jgi:hypothetical protein
MTGRLHFRAPVCGSGEVILSSMKTKQGHAFFSSHSNPKTQRCAANESAGTARIVARLNATRP